jgi:hypothetical protein
MDRSRCLDGSNPIRSIPTSSDPSLSDVQLILDMRYEDDAAMNAALASPQHAQNGEETKTLLSLMSDPKVEHIVLGK